MQSKDYYRLFLNQLGFTIGHKKNKKKKKPCFTGYGQEDLPSRVGRLGIKLGGNA